MQKWQYLGMGCRSVGLGPKALFEIRHPRRGEEKGEGRGKNPLGFQIFILGHPHGWAAQAGESRKGKEVGSLAQSGLGGHPCVGISAEAAGETLR